MKQFFILLLLVSSIFTQTASDIEKNKFEELYFKNEIFALQDNSYGLQETEENVPTVLVWVIKVAVTAIIGEIVKRVFNAVQERMNNGHFVQYPVSGGNFVSNIQDGWVCAAFYHPSKSHTATADGGILGGGVIRSTARAGEWATACSKAGPLGGRKTYYNVL